MARQVIVSTLGCGTADIYRLGFEISRRFLAIEGETWLQQSSQEPDESEEFRYLD